MKLTPSQKRALEMIAKCSLTLVTRDVYVRGNYSGDNPDEQAVEFEQPTFVQTLGWFDNQDKYRNEIINGRSYCIRPKLKTVSRKVIGELINKSLVEIKIETTTTYNDINAVITAHGLKTLATLPD